MTEFRKFIRYVVPVLACTFYSYMLLALIFGTLDIARWDLQLPSPPTAGAGTAAVLLALFAAFGFLISSVHHMLFRRCRIYPTVRYQSFLQRLVNEHELVFDGRSPDLADEGSNWNIVNVIWHSLRTKDSTWDKINERNDSLTDLMHSTGATYVAVWFAILITGTAVVGRTCWGDWPLLPANHCDCFRLAATAIIVASLLKIHFAGLKMTTRNLESFVQTALFHVLRLQNKEKGGHDPYRFYVL